jgi:hypothetical protein
MIFTVGHWKSIIVVSKTRQLKNFTHICIATFFIWGGGYYLHNFSSWRTFIFHIKLYKHSKNYEKTHIVRECSDAYLSKISSHHPFSHVIDSVLWIKVIDSRCHVANVDLCSFLAQNQLFALSHYKIGHWFIVILARYLLFWCTRNHVGVTLTFEISIIK